jgi:3-oxoacyl-[acyl-carrier-protein] synthase II
MGHALGAAGAIEAAMTCLTIARSVVPPTVGLVEVDPECAANHLHQTREQPVRAALSNSFGFGGTDTSLLFARNDVAPVAATTTRPRSVVITGGGTVGPLGTTGSEGAADYVASSRPPSPGADCGELALDLQRARRFDRPARLATVAIERSLREAGLLDLAVARQCRIGATVGSAFGSVGTTGRYLLRLFEKGARWASPALFPAALPSALGANPSLYLGLTGPVLSTADLAVSAESSLVTAIELVAAGDADAMAAAAVEERSEVAARVSGPLCSGLNGAECRGEGAAALVIETATAARARGVAIRAFVARWTSWRGAGHAELADFPPPPLRAAVYRARQPLDADPLPPPWRPVPSFAVAPRAGDHESVGGFAAAAAVAAIETGAFEAVLVLGAAGDRGHALLLQATESRD